jgi:hypothetical protein
MLKKISLLAAMAVSSFSGAFAQEAAPEEAPKGKFSVSGYVDVNYFHNFNMPKSMDNQGASGVGRGFDRSVNTFQVGGAQTLFKYATPKTEMVIDLLYGNAGQFGTYGNSKTYTGIESAILLKQAYVKYNATDKLSFTIGQFSTHIGYELIESSLNYFYTINHTFNSGIPFYHTGLKATYMFSDKVSLMLGAVNGFDAYQDNNRALAATGQLALTPMEGLSVYANYFISDEATKSSGVTNSVDPRGVFQVAEVNGTYALTEKFSLGWWFLFGAQHGTAFASPSSPTPGTFPSIDNKGGYTDGFRTWGGANLYLMYTASDLLDLGLRAEYFDNTSGARGIRQSASKSNTSFNPLGTDVWGITLTPTIKLDGGNLLIKPELRYDIWGAKKDAVTGETLYQFQDASGEYNTNNQLTFGAAVIYKY